LFLGHNWGITYNWVGVNESWDTLTEHLYLFLVFLSSVLPPRLTPALPGPCGAGPARRIHEWTTPLFFNPHPHPYHPRQVIDINITGFHGIDYHCWAIIIVNDTMATNAPWPEESVSERAGTVHLRVTKPRWHLPILVLRHGFVLPVYRGLE